jgi:hypothetical protein
MKSFSRCRVRFAAVVLASILAAIGAAYAADPAPASLAPPERFAGISDTNQRSATMFTELGKVLTHPRCVNCHPAGDRPHQTDLGRPHQPPVWRGENGHGLAAMRCSTCHQGANFEPGRIPGHPEWHLAPREMAWEGKTLSEICEQIKDSKRNGGRQVADLIHHIGSDTLVGWAWSPGTGRAPAPGTQKTAGALVQAWVQTGAACP